MGRFAFLFLFYLLLLSCTKTLKSEIESFTGQQITLPAEMDPDSVDVSDTQNKLIIWFDSTECGSCRMSRMYEWDDDPAVQYAQGLPGKFEVIMIFSPKKEDVRSLTLNLKNYDVSFPVIIDETGDFPSLNPQIPADKRLHAFLLDKDNKVVMVGNPLGNEPLWKLYKEQIRTLVNEPQGVVRP
jgi:thiol-disulfide isomerase/thioredoxin